AAPEKSSLKTVVQPDGGGGAGSATAAGAAARVAAAAPVRPPAINARVVRTGRRLREAGPRSARRPIRVMSSMVLSLQRAARSSVRRGVRGGRRQGGAATRRWVAPVVVFDTRVASGMCRASMGERSPNRRCVRLGEGAVKRLRADVRFRATKRRGRVGTESGARQLGP